MDIDMHTRDRKTEISSTNYLKKAGKHEDFSILRVSIDNSTASLYISEDKVEIIDEIINELNDIKSFLTRKKGGK